MKRMKWNLNVYALIIKHDIFQFLYKSFPLFRYKDSNEKNTHMHTHTICIHPDISIQNIIIH